MKRGTMRARARVVNLPASLSSGERRLPACCRRQLADDDQSRLFRLAAETSTLAACAPGEESCALIEL
jgi:hypothetical protein